MGSLQLNSEIWRTGSRSNTWTQRTNVETRRRCQPIPDECSPTSDIACSRPSHWTAGASPHEKLPHNWKCSSNAMCLARVCMERREAINELWESLTRSLWLLFYVSCMRRNCFYKDLLYGCAEQIIHPHKLGFAQNECVSSFRFSKSISTVMF